MLAGAYSVCSIPPIALIEQVDIWSPKATSFLSVLQVGHLITATGEAKGRNDRKAAKELEKVHSDW